MTKKHYVLILLGLGLLTRFLFFGYPNETVFDEVHFGKFISGYYTGEYFFDIHPPLGKLAIAGFAKIFNFQPGFAFAEIGNQFPDKQYLFLRFLPSLAGSLLPLIFFLLLLELKINPVASFIGGLLLIFENSLLVQSRFVLLDSFLLLFGLLILLFYFKHTNLHQRRSTTSFLILMGLFGGLTISIKWTGLGFLALPFIFELFDIIKTRRFKKIGKSIVMPLAIAGLVYFIIFTVHFSLLNKSGPGDAFMSIGFQKTLAGSVHESSGAKSSNIIQKFTELNVEMYKANQRLDATHPYSSTWYSWPAMTRPIYYWVKNNPEFADKLARIYLIGNPIIWWLSSFVILVWLSRLLNNPKKIINNKIILFLVTGYILNILPFIGVKRVMFLYHYFGAYMFALMMSTYLISDFVDESTIKNKRTFWISVAGLGIIIISFIYFSPLSYGLNLTSSAYENRVWMDSWR